MIKPKTIYAKDILDIINHKFEDRCYAPRDTVEYFIIRKFDELCTKVAEYVNQECQSIDELKKHIPENNIRALNCLKNERIKYMEELVYLSTNDLLKTPNFGIKSLTIIRDAWIKSGHSIKELVGETYRNGKYTLVPFEFIW